MSSDKMKVNEKVSVAIHTMTPEEKAKLGTPEELERIRRLKSVPPTWYCVAANEEEVAQEWWIKELIKGDWLKLVLNDATVIIGKTLKILDSCVKLVADTVLYDNQIDEKRTSEGMLSLQKDNIIQVFTNNEDVAYLIRQERKKANGNG